MVKELVVNEPAPKNQDWERETNLWYELVFEGVPLPEDEKELLRDRYNFVYADRDEAAVRAEKQWDAYMSVQGDLSEDTRSPRERLDSYFNDPSTPK